MAKGREAQSGFKFGTSFDDIIDDLKGRLEKGDSGHLTYRYVKEQKGSKTKVRWPAGMPSLMQQAAKTYLGPQGDPYGHQVKAWEALYAGKSVILTTPTASGKTLAFNPPILDAVLRGGSALYLYTLVDLATSQKDALQNLMGAYPWRDGQRKPRVTAQHSSSDEEWEARIQGQQDFVLSTPDTLHKHLLPANYPNWKDFFKRLGHVVLDEAHMYSGIFGTNMALILRRLAHRCLREGGRIPQFVLCSATIRDPKGFAARLLPPGSPEPVLIDKASSDSPGHHEMAFLAPEKEGLDLFIRLLDASITDRFGERRPVRTIMFINSRKGVEHFADTVRNSMRKHNREDLCSRFTSYRAGKAQATELFARFKAGKIQSIVTTNKLMAGIDIGNLDVSIVMGFQRRLLDMRQMFGRAGRKDAGAWIFIGKPESLEDQFIIDAFPEVFECPEPEATVVDLSNPRLRQAHLACLNGCFAEAYRQEGPAHREYVTALFGGDTLIPAREAQAGYPWTSPPLSGMQLRGSNVNATYSLVLDGRPAEEEDDDKISEYHTFRDYHPGAVFGQGEKVYEVIELQRTPACRVIAKRSPVDNIRTRCSEKVTDQLLESQGTAERNGIAYHLGTYTVVQVFASYDILALTSAWVCPHRDCMNAGAGGDSCPLHKKKYRYYQTWKREETRTIAEPLHIEVPDTVGVSVELDDVLAKVHEQRGETDEKDNLVQDLLLLNSLKTLLINSFEDAFLAEGDILGAIVKPDRSILFYDNFPGGIGIARMIYEDAADQLWKKAHDRIHNCRCTQPEGCPKCILPLFAHAGQSATKQDVVDLIESVFPRLKPLTEKPRKAVVSGKAVQVQRMVEPAQEGSEEYHLWLKEMKALFTAFRERSFSVKSASAIIKTSISMLRELDFKEYSDLSGGKTRGKAWWEFIIFGKVPLRYRFTPDLPGEGFPESCGFSLHVMVEDPPGSGKFVPLDEVDSDQPGLMEISYYCKGERFHYRAFDADLDLVVKEGAAVEIAEFFFSEIEAKMLQPAKPMRGNIVDVLRGR